MTQHNTAQRCAARNYPMMMPPTNLHQRVIIFADALRVDFAALVCGSRTSSQHAAISLFSLMKVRACIQRHALKQPWVSVAMADQDKHLQVTRAQGRPANSMLGDWKCQLGGSTPLPLPPGPTAHHNKGQAFHRRAVLDGDGKTCGSMHRQGGAHGVGLLSNAGPISLTASLLHAIAPTPSSGPFAKWREGRHGVAPQRLLSFQ